MTDTSKPKQTEKQLQNLELNKETLQDLTECDAQNVKGGMARTPDIKKCTGQWSGCGTVPN